MSEVSVRLRCGDGVQRKEDVSTSFTDKSCHVAFPGTSRAGGEPTQTRSPACDLGLCSCFRWTTVELPAAGGDRGLLQ